MAHAQVGAGSAYAYTIPTARETSSTGPAPTAFTWTLTPAKNFWSVDLYDTQTRSLLQVPSTIWPALASNTGTLQANGDGSHDLYFGPVAPEGKGSNWVETIPGKSWFQLFRLYGPLQPWLRPDVEARRVRAPRLTNASAAEPRCDAVTPTRWCPAACDVMSTVTRLTSRTSLVIRVEIRSSTSYGRRAQSAVIASSEVTGRSTTGWP